MENLHLIVGLGNPGAEYAEDATQRRVFAGRAAGRPLAGEMDDRKKVPVARGASGTGWPTVAPVPAADVHERQRRSGRSVGEFLSGAGREIAGGGGRCGFAVGRNPVAAARQQRRPSRAGVHRAASGHARICAAADRHRAQRRRAGNHGPCAGQVERREAEVDGKSFNGGGRPGGMLVGRRNTKSNESV